MKLHMVFFLALFVGARYIGMASSCWCNTEWNPQCGKNIDRKEVLYRNSCLMSCDGAEQTKAEDCGPDVCICSYIYHLVCGEKDGTKKNYSNDCLMKCDGATLVNHGKCEEDSCFCTKEFRPVCGEKDGNYKTYGNKCTMECDGAKFKQERECA